MGYLVFWLVVFSLLTLNSFGKAMDADSRLGGFAWLTLAAICALVAAVIMLVLAAPSV